MLGSPTLCRSAEFAAIRGCDTGEPIDGANRPFGRSAALSARARQLTPEARIERFVPLARRWWAVALAAAVSVIAAPVSVAQTGGALAPGPPQVTTVTCLSPAPPCGKRRTVLGGREFVMRGSNLDSVGRVVFTGSPGGRDDKATAVLRGNPRYLVATVPPAARSGPLNVVSKGGGNQLTGVRRVTVSAAPKSAPMDLAPSGSSWKCWPALASDWARLARPQAQPMPEHWRALRATPGGSRRRQTGQD